MYRIKLKFVPNNEYVKLSSSAQKTYQRRKYCRTQKKYSLLDFDDFNRELFRSGETFVYVGFTF